MNISLQANGFSPEGTRLQPHQVFIDRHPNECPICHVTIMPEVTYQPWRAGETVECFYHCSSSKCHRSFLALYERVDPIKPNGPLEFTLKACYPITPTKVTFDDEIRTVSPTFISIYEQATSAENHRLEDIAGPGYRKALEFLIKDYAIYLHPERAQAVKSSDLMYVIKNFLSGDSLPLVSSRATWLGNDETHYEKRWVGKDLSDLKKLIAATVHFITMQRLVVDLPADMPDPKLSKTDPTLAPQ
jgi:hypothetical protein